MTLEQATQKILDKTLSLTDGWVLEYQITDSVSQERYAHPELRGASVMHTTREVTYLPWADMTVEQHKMAHKGVAMLITDTAEPIVTSDALLKHVSVIRESVARAALKAKEESIIAIAQQINS